MEKRLHSLLDLLTNTLGRKPAIDEVEKGLKIHLQRKIDDLLKIHLLNHTAAEIIQMMTLLEALKSPKPPYEVEIKQDVPPKKNGRRNRPSNA